MFITLKTNTQILKRISLVETTHFVATDFNPLLKKTEYFVATD